MLDFQLLVLVNQAHKPISMYHFDILNNANLIDLHEVEVVLLEFNDMLDLQPRVLLKQGHI